MLPFTLQQLRVFKAVATEKNFTKAAELLYLSQPSLSKQIGKLEKTDWFNNLVAHYPIHKNISYQPYRHNDTFHIRRRTPNQNKT